MVACAVPVIRWGFAGWALARNISASYAISATASIGASESISARNRTFTEVTSPTLTGCRPNRAPRRCGHRPLGIQSKFRIPDRSL